MTTFLFTSLVLVLVDNLVLAVIKNKTGKPKLTKNGLRLLLTICTVAGVLTASAITGNPIDLDRVTDIFILILWTGTVSVGAHYSYKLIKYS